MNFKWLSYFFLNLSAGSTIALLYVNRSSSGERCAPYQALLLFTFLFFDLVIYFDTLNFSLHGVKENYDDEYSQVLYIHRYTWY